jgi:hypothetical protein
MTLTLAGKIALFANLALSLMFAFWGFGIYSQRVNWTDKKIGEREGEYAIRAAQIKQLQDSRQRVDRRWQESTQGLVRLEDLRPVKQAWYKKQTEILKTGDANQKIMDIDFNQGQIKIDPKTGLPMMKVVTDQTNKPIPGLGSLPVLNDAYGRRQLAIVAVTEEIKKLIEEEEKLRTEQLGDGKVRGLRFDLAQQQLAEKQSLDEQEYLQPLLYNSMVEQQSLEERHKVLEDRLKQASSVAKQP